jgi:hypothetical protein
MPVECASCRCRALRSSGRCTLSPCWRSAEWSWVGWQAWKSGAVADKIGYFKEYIHPRHCHATKKSEAIACAKEMPVILINKVVDPKRIIQKNGGPRRRRRGTRGRWPIKKSTYTPWRGVWSITKQNNCSLWEYCHATVKSEACASRCRSSCLSRWQKRKD